MCIIGVFFLFLVLGTVITYGITISTSSEGIHHKGIIAPYFNISMINQDPDPVEPGEIVEVRFKIENTLGQTMHNVEFELFLDYPFSVYRDSPVKNLGKMQGAQTGADAVIIDFLIKVDEGAAEGLHELEARVKVAKGLYQLFDEDEFLIDVQTIDPILTIEKVKIEPGTLSPGKHGNVTFFIVNEDDTLLKNIHIRLDLDDTPVLPYQSTNEQWIGKLSSGYKKQMTFPIVIDPTADGGLYKIPISISFLNIRGNKSNKTNIISIPVGGKPKLKTYLRDQEIFQTGTAGKIVIEVANPTTLDVKFLELEIGDDPSFSLLTSNNYVYLGDVDSDDTESEIFMVYFEKKAEQITIPVHLRYQDPQNNIYEEDTTITIKPLTPSEMKRFGLAQSSYIIWIVVIILLGVGSYIYWRKKRKNRIK